MPTVECQWCGQPFHAKPNKISKNLARFCSRECSAASRKQSKPWIECPICHKSFKQTRPEQITCSPECGNQSGKNKLKGTRKVGKRIVYKSNPVPRHSDYALSFDPWSTGDIQPDEYGRGLYREIDPVLGF